MTLIERSGLFLYAQLWIKRSTSQNWNSADSLLRLKAMTNLNAWMRLGGRCQLAANRSRTSHQWASVKMLRKWTKGSAPQHLVTRQDLAGTPNQMSLSLKTMRCGSHFIRRPQWKRSTCHGPRKAFSVAEIVILQIREIRQIRSFIQRRHPSLKPCLAKNLFKLLLKQ